jgi:hypothetical protein
MCGDDCPVCGPRRESGSDDTLPEIDEIAAAAELLEATDEAALDRFFDRQIRAAAGGGHRLPPETFGLLRGIAKQALRQALPSVGRRPTPFTRRASAATAAAGGRLFGVEFEGLSPEDAELAAARRAVRFARSAARGAARASRRLPPRAAAMRAATAAARRWAPGLLRRRPAAVAGTAVATVQAAPAPVPDNGPAAANQEPAPPPASADIGADEPGTWVRRGRTIVVVC